MLPLFALADRCGSYEIERLIASNIDGDRHEARHVLTGAVVELTAARVAIAVPDLGHQVREAVRRRAAVRHPHLAEVRGGGVLEGGRAIWVALELARGSTLREVIRERGRLPVADAIAHVAALAGAASALHEAGVELRQCAPRTWSSTSTAVRSYATSRRRASASATPPRARFKTR